MAKNPSNGFFYINDNSIRVPMALFAKNRERLAAELRKCGQRKSVVLLQGGEELGLCAGDSADVNAVFQQEAFFHWVGTPAAGANPMIFKSIATTPALYVVG
jgi:hypothetical protein